MVDKSIVIIGGGPAGLTAAYELMKEGQKPIVLEKSALVGGIARTENYKGYRFDIGGHRFFTKVDVVQHLWREVLQDDFLTRPRLSRIYYQNKFYNYPLKIGNVLQNLGLIESARILLSYLRAQAFPHPHPETFEQWVTNRFGWRLYQMFFKTYTEKVWGIPCSEISADWAAQRIKDLSLFSAVRNALIGSRGNTIKTLIEEFEYPRLGPGMLWERIQQLLTRAGHPVLLETEVVKIHHRNHRSVTCVTAANTAGKHDIAGAHVISTMPLNHLIARLDPPPPPDVRDSARQLTYRDFLTVVLIVNNPNLFPDNWIYVHSPTVRVGRIQNFKNWSEAMVPDAGTTSLGLEYFCAEGDSLWNMSDVDLLALGRREIKAIGLAQIEDIMDGIVLRQKKAYPVYTGEYKVFLDTIRAYLDKFENLQTVGRNGLHMYNNQDHSMLTAMLAVKNILGEQHNVWNVNVDRAYHEEIRLPAGSDSQKTI